MRVLLVEDERPIRDAFQAYLDKEGFWVTAVEDGAAALEVASRKPFDLVGLDLNLPKVPGEIVCRRIRDASDVPIILLTAKGSEEERVRGLEMGADDSLVKPFSPRELVARVRALLRRPHAESDPQRDRIEAPVTYEPDIVPFLAVLLVLAWLWGLSSSSAPSPCGVRCCFMPAPICWSCWGPSLPALRRS